MPNMTVTDQAELVLAQEMTRAAATKDFGGALARAERGARKYPKFTIPAGAGQPRPTFAQAAEWLRGKIAESESAVEESAVVAAPEVVEESAAVPAPRKRAARKAAPVKAAPAPAEPVAAPVEPAAPAEPVKAAEPAVLRLVHNGTDPTSIYGVEKGSPAHLTIGSKRNGGLGWHFWAGGPCFYITRSGGYAVDHVAINLAISKLESLTGDDGAQLYRVQAEISTHDAAGKPLPVRMSADEARRWQLRYDAARNTLWAAMGLRKALCGACGAQGLDQRTGRIGKGDDGMPQVECYTCGGFAAAEPVAVPVPVAAPAVVAEPVAAPVPVVAPAASVVDLTAMLALSAVAEPKPESAQCPLCKEDVPVVGGELGLHTRRFGNGACRGRLGMTVADVEPEPAAPVKARKAAAPVVVDDGSDGESGLVVRFALQAGLSNSARNQTATEVRQALVRRITSGRAFRGVRVETRRDKVNHQLTLTVTDGAEGFDVEELGDAIAAAVKSVRGVGNRVRKA